MSVPDLLLERRSAAGLLILSALVFVVAGLLFTGRAIWRWPAGETSLYLRWERGLVLAAFMINVLGFVLLEELLRQVGGLIVARPALMIYLVGAAVLVVAETTFLDRREFVYTQIVAHVVLSFLAQAAFGATLLQTGLVAPWVGWATLIWNLAWLIILPLVYPRDMYFPWLHYAAPLTIGIALLAR